MQIFFHILKVQTYLIDVVFIFEIWLEKRLEMRN